MPRVLIKYRWHGDIKPENILDVQGRFKLADPGEACVVTVPKDPTGPRDSEKIPRTQVPGGTVSFGTLFPPRKLLGFQYVDDLLHLAAPEKNAYRYGGTEEIPHVTQGIDIWSLGCVFSVAATYVVAGKEGVKQYRLLRQRAILKLGHGYGDAFHDTRKVLPEVTQWHEYLRTSTRGQDTFTSKVLDIVDNDMLIVPGQSRISGPQLSSTLAEINKDAQRQNRDQLQPPDEILNFLDEVMRSTAGERAASLEEIPRTISQSGASMFDEALLYQSMRSDGRTPIRKIVPPETDGMISSSSHAEQQSYAVSHPYLNHDVRFGYSNLPEIITDLANLPKYSNKRAADDPPVTFWEVEAQLNQHGTRRSIPGITVLNKRVSVYGKAMDGKEDQLLKHFKNRDLVSALSHVT